MPGLRNVSGRVALVTGASSGIGAEFARQLARGGARVAVVARREARLQELVDEIVAAGAEASAHVCDLEDANAIDQAAAEIIARWGTVDVLVNNAGYGRHLLFEDHDVEDIERMMLTNYMGTVRFIKAVWPGMKARGEGWIVNLSSFAGKLGQADEVAYSASKFAITGLSQGLAQEFAPHGVHVMSLHPTLVRTEMFTPDVLARMPARTKASFIEVDAFVRAALEALARGYTEAVIPRRMKGVMLLNELFPAWMSRQVGKVKLAAIAKAERASR